MISETDLIWWSALHDAYALTDIRAVCDLGQPEVFDEGSGLFDSACRRFAQRCGILGTDLAPCRSSAALWHALGRRIVSIDVVGTGDDFRHLDLNRDTAPVDLGGRSILSLTSAPVSTFSISTLAKADAYDCLDTWNSVEQETHGLSPDLLNFFRVVISCFAI